MTRDQIKAELRRSACEDARPIVWCHRDAFFAMLGYWDKHVDTFRDYDMRVAILLVAEALEE